MRDSEGREREKGGDGKEGGREGRKGRKDKREERKHSERSTGENMFLISFRKEALDILGFGEGREGTQGGRFPVGGRRPPKKNINGKDLRILARFDSQTPKKL